MRWTILIVAGLAMAGIGLAGALGAAPMAKSGPAMTSTEAAAAPPAATPPAPPKPLTAAEKAEAAKQAQEEAKTRQAMAGGRPTMEFQGAAVKDILNYLAEVGKFSIVFDKALDDAGIDLAHVPATLKASGLTYEQVIQLVLPRECGYRIEAGYVLITMLEKSWVPLILHSYDIHMAMATIPDFGGMAPRFNINQLGAQGKGGAAPLFTQPQVVETAAPPTADQIIALIKQFVRNSDDPRIAPWSDDGGPATVQAFGGYLVVSQTYVGHMKVMKILAMIE